MADLEIVKEEKERILKSIILKDFLNMQEYFLVLNDQERLGVILEYKKMYLTTEKEIEKSLLDVKKGFLADHKFQSVEQCYYLFLNKFLHK
jgi:hypothetical protein